MPVIQVFLIGIIVLVTLVIFYFVPVGMWIQGVVSLGLGRIRIVDLIRMRLRKISPRLVTDGVINLHKAGLAHISTDMLETHFLAGGNVQNIVSALIAADKANIQLPFETATAIDLAGRDVNEAVQTSVYPKVINAPKDGYLAAVAKDGIELKARARVTVRTNIPGLVGGAMGINRMRGGEEDGFEEMFEDITPGPLELNCPTCNGLISITTTQRPIQIGCPMCQSQFVIRE